MRTVWWGVAVLVAALAGRGVWADERPLVERVKLAGDLRLRHESDLRRDSAPDRHRQRVRFRAQAKVPVLAEAGEIGARLRTGDFDDPNSPHQTAGNTLNSYRVALDRLYLNWRPPRLEGASLTAGKFAHPFYANPVYGELVWDADVNPEGVAAGYTAAGTGPVEKLELTAGHYLLNEAFPGEVTAFAAQAAVHGRAAGRCRPVLALGYYRYGELAVNGTSAITADNAGNKVAAGDFQSGFEVLNPILAATVGEGAWPLTLSAEFVHNSRAFQGDEDSGYAAGLAVGRGKDPGDVQVFYQWQLVEQEAVLTPFAQDDHYFATNYRGHMGGVRYPVAQSAELRLWGLVFARDETTAGSATADSDKDQWRARADLNIAF